MSTDRTFFVVAEAEFSDSNVATTSARSQQCSEFA